jgi:hypothetical protein
MNDPMDPAETDRTQLKREQSLWPTAECLLRLAEDPGSARPERHFPSTQLKRE